MGLDWTSPPLRAASVLASVTLEFTSRPVGLVSTSSESGVRGLGASLLTGADRASLAAAPSTPISTSTASADAEVSSAELPKPPAFTA